MKIDLLPSAFVDGSADLSSEWESAIEDVLEELRKEPSVLTLNYEGQDGQIRLDALAERIQQAWGDGPYELEIRTNTISDSDRKER